MQKPLLPYLDVGVEWRVGQEYGSLQPPLKTEQGWKNLIKDQLQEVIHIIHGCLVFDQFSSSFPFSKLRVIKSEHGFFRCSGGLQTSSVLIKMQCRQVKPGESALMSPPTMAFCSFSLSVRPFCVVFHLCMMAGSINVLACRRKVLYWNILSLIPQKIFATLKKEPPLEYIATDS